MWQRTKSSRKSRRRKGIFLLFLMILILFLSRAFVLKEKKLRADVFLWEKMSRECTAEEIKKLSLEVKVFPVRQKEKMTYENGYGGERSYGGKRKHEGIDIIPEKEKGTYQVVAAADGIVEKIGWLTLGGYRVGIRSKGGFYYYYAHLASYGKGIKKGSQVKAGDVIGIMGNTGYGKEGTTGKFVVHLHFGIYRQVDGEEKSLNPYFLLQLSGRYGAS